MSDASCNERYNLRADSAPMTATFEAIRKSGDRVEFCEPVAGQVEAMQRAREQGWTLIGLRVAR